MHKLQSAIRHNTRSCYWFDLTSLNDATAEVPLIKQHCMNSIFVKYTRRVDCQIAGAALLSM
jgi:hypothetical protein